MVNQYRPTKCVAAAPCFRVLITENTHQQQVQNQTGNVVRDESADAGAYYNPVPGNVSQSTYTAFRGDNISQPFYVALGQIVYEGK